MGVKAIPEGYHNVTPYLIVDDAAEAIRFYEKALGATEIFRLPMGDKVGHAELQIGDSVVMLADEFPERDIRGPKARGSEPMIKKRPGFRGRLSPEERRIAEQLWGGPLPPFR